MKTFTYIAHKLFIRDVKYKPNIDFDACETNVNDSIRRISYMEHIFSNQNNLHADLMKCIFVLSNEPKFKGLDQNTGDNFLVSSENQNIFLDFFSEIQKVYWAFANFAKRIKHRYSTNKVDHDLLLTPISITQRNVIHLYENDSTYLFTLQDLSHIIIAAICNSPSFHSEPLNPKNPYSGVAFSKTNLYNIYFYMKERFSVVPEGVHKFFLTNFDIELFGEKYKLIIRDIFINQFVDNEDKDEIVENIYDMINECYTQINIHEDFPDDILINTFKSALINYLHYIERQTGRETGTGQFNSRTLDIDLLLYGDLIDKSLNLPRDEILEYDGPVICEVIVPADQKIIPTVSSRVNDDGSMSSRPLEDMYPFLDRSEYFDNLYVDDV